MENFVFRNPTKIIFGEGEISKIGKELNKDGLSKILLVYGKGSIHKNGVYDQVVQSLGSKDIEFIELSGIKPNPVLSKVNEGIKVCREENIQGIVAVGGGSVIDTAKTIAAGVYYQGNIWDIFVNKAQVSMALPIFTVLTISATGSEMDPGAVITNEIENKKWSFGSAYVYPRVSIIDPTVQFTLPKMQTVNGAIDAMSHVFEFYFEGIKNRDVQDEFAEGILRTVIKHIHILLKEPENYESRSQLAWCATLALNGIIGVGGLGGDWASHDIEHTLSAYTDVSHGAGLAIVFPAWMEYVYKEDPDKFQRFAERIFNITEGDQEEKIIKGIKALKDFYKELGAPTTIKELGVKREELERFATNAAINAPLGKLKRLDKSDILKIFEIAYE